jgi:hypothetical protein
MSSAASGDPGVNAIGSNLWTGVEANGGIWNESVVFDGAVAVKFVRNSARLRIQIGGRARTAAPPTFGERSLNRSWPASGNESVVWIRDDG